MPLILASNHSGMAFPWDAIVFAGGEMKKMRLSFISLLTFIFKNPITLAYFVPIIGWIPILIKGYRDHSIEKNSGKSDSCNTDGIEKERY